MVEKAEMKRLIWINCLLMATLALSVLLNFNSAFVFASATPPQALSADGEPTLQEWFSQNGYAINVTTDETGNETFPPGCYKVTILTEIADYAPLNNLSWYPASNGQLNYIFLGENNTGDTTCFMANETFGLCLGSPQGYFYTETQRNEDGKDHALVFMNPNATGYIIAWEDLWKLGDADFQDFVLAALTPVNVNVCYCPKTLNLKSKGRWITALIRLPKEYRAEDVNISSIMLNGTVPADLKHYKVYDCGDLHLLVIKFNRKAVIELIRSSLKNADCKKKFLEVSLTITGEFLNGIPFQGTNKIRVIHFSCWNHHTSAVKKSQFGFSYHLIDIHATLLRLLRVCCVNRLS
jgi:hypothetical protein